MFEKNYFSTPNWFIWQFTFSFKFMKVFVPCTCYLVIQAHIYVHSRYSTDWTNFLYYIESYYMWCKIFLLLLCLLNCPTRSKREQTEMTQIRMILTFSPRFQSNKCIWKWIMLHKRMWLALITYSILKMNFFLRMSILNMSLNPIIIFKEINIGSNVNSWNPICMTFSI